MVLESFMFHTFSDKKMNNWFQYQDSAETLTNTM